MLCFLWDFRGLGRIWFSSFIVVSKVCAELPSALSPVCGWQQLSTDLAHHDGFLFIFFLGGYFIFLGLKRVSFKKKKKIASSYACMHQFIFTSLNHFSLVWEGELSACAQSASLNQKALVYGFSWFIIHCHSAVSKVSLWPFQQRLWYTFNEWRVGLYSPGKLPNVWGH